MNCWFEELTEDRKDNYWTIIVRNICLAAFVQRGNFGLFPQVGEDSEMYAEIEDIVYGWQYGITTQFDNSGRDTI